ncbi:hypothetical protein Bcep1808_4903 [Burkholderia vietnamiensis G4]|uniref:Uncharacterized protein n=1 Tax=Burkholderia vietnamiensis (strain G4 / LMG 22486) TaxID=269482 RepID=A4JNK7_BURVG|nr:hypothetical protein Bcep1808_4903 [Burkholderia vietnamiensis G4]
MHRCGFARDQRHLACRRVDRSKDRYARRFAAQLAASNRKHDHVPPRTRYRAIAPTTNRRDDSDTQSKLDGPKCRVKQRVQTAIRQFEGARQAARRGRTTRARHGRGMQVRAVSRPCIGRTCQWIPIAGAHRPTATSARTDWQRRAGGRY